MAHPPQTPPQTPHNTHSGPAQFVASASAAIHDDTLQRALANLKRGFPVKRAEVVADLPEFDALRDQARDIKDHMLDNLDAYLEIYEENVRRAGGRVHWARTGDEATRIILDLCRDAGAKIVTKGKSMVAEEIGLNEALDENGFQRVETDLGEYIIQLRREPPSHIIAPAVHVTKDEIAETFRAAHDGLPPDRDLSEARAITDEARTRLRDSYFAAEVGITGANFLIADSGSGIIVTNEGNGDLTQTLARVHITVASIEKLVGTMEDAFTMLRLLARSATGQEFSVYTTVSTGPRRAGDPDGPEAWHVVLVDNGRSALLGTGEQEMLRCIRCAACMNHCPVYGAVGGHAYGWVYPGPMGAVLTPALVGVDAAAHLPNASTFCGRCEEVCPMRIPLTTMMRRYRAQAFQRGHGSKIGRLALRVWAYLWSRPRLAAPAVVLARSGLRLMAMGRASLRFVPFAAGWTRFRDLPVPEKSGFLAQYKRGRRR